MRIELFELRFDNSHAIYTSGQMVTGSVVLKLNKATWIDCILIKFIGVAKSKWEVNYGDSSKTYQAYETYFDCEYCLYKSNNDSEKLPIGMHVYPFDFALPTEAPSSFEGRRGYIRYNCLVTLDRGWKGRLEVEQDLAVVRHLDVGALPDAGMPVHVEKEDVYEGCCCNSGFVSAKLRLQKRGYVSGEPCRFDLYINNQATSSIRGVSLFLIQTVHYTGYSHSVFSSGSPKFHDKKNLWSLFELEDEIHSLQEFHFSECCVIPAVAPSLLEGCNIIEIMYEIQMSVPTGLTSLLLNSPVYIGTIPLRLSQPSPTIDPHSATELLSSPPVRASSDAPPSYEECVFGRMESQEGQEDMMEGDNSAGTNSSNTAADANNTAASRRSRFHRLPSYPYYNMSHFTEPGPASNAGSSALPHTTAADAPPSMPPNAPPPPLPPSSSHEFSSALMSPPDNEDLDSNDETLPPPPSYESLQNSSMEQHVRLLPS